METLDWTQLLDNVVPDTKKISYNQNKHLFTKIAFDVFQLNTSPVESLWVLENDDDGKQFLVAKYNERQEVKQSDWIALSDKKRENVTLAYKNTPIQRFASAEYGFSNNDVYIFQQALVSKLNTNKDFVLKLINSQPEERRVDLLKQFPELLA